MTLQAVKQSRYLPWQETSVPVIDATEDFGDVVRKLTDYMVKIIDTAYSYEQLRTTIIGQSLRPLLTSLSEDCHHPGIVAALLAARYVFNESGQDDPRLTQTRAHACELVAWQFLTFLSERELIDYLLYELPCSDGEDDQPQNSAADVLARGETDPLLDHQSDVNEEERRGIRPPKRATLSLNRSASSLQLSPDPDSDEEDLSRTMAGMNALEIAAVANAKKFLSQRPVQTVVDDVWNGNIIFWDSLSVKATKRVKIYNKRTADPFSRLRVPKYQKAFQVAFFAVLLFLYYTVLVQRNPRKVTGTELLLYAWIAAFAYDEFGEIRDAGLLFYRTDFWSIWDLAIILVCIAFFVARVVGLARDSNYITDVAFDILSMAALFLVPRMFSVASLNPYFGSLLPVLKEMTTAFCKFLPVIVILYLGFLTTFTMLARDRLSIKEVSWLLIKVFFGSSYLGFDFAVQISPIFGYTLMVIFVALTNILLLTALVSLVSNSLTEVMAHARDEYLFQYSIYVLESCTSRRLTYFLPPTNLIPLLFLRPLRLILPSDTVRRLRIVLLKCVSIPFVALIWCYEGLSRILSENGPVPARARMRVSSAGRQSRGPSSRVSTLGIGSALKSKTQPTPVEERPDSITTARKQSDEDLMSLVQRLSTQVEELTALVTAQRTD